jgi:hypothetical protein
VIDRLTESLSERTRSAEHAFQEKLQELEAQETSSAGQKLQQKSEREVEEARRLISKRVDWAVDSLNLATGAAAGKLYAAYRKTEADFKALSADYPQKLAGLSNASFESISRKTESLLTDFQAQLQKTWNEFQEKGTREFSARVDKASEQLLEQWAKEIDRRAGDVLEMLSEQLKTSGLQMTEETKKQLASVNQSTREALAREAKSSVETMGMLGEKLAASGEAMVGETAKQLSAMTRFTLESLSQEAHAASEECRAQARRTLEEFGQRGLKELEAQFQRAGEKHRENMLRQLQREADDSSERALTQIRNRSEQVAKEASDTVYKQVGVGAVVLKDWADQARTQLESSLQRSAEAFEKRIAELSQITLDKHRQGSEVLVEDLRARLQQAARIFQDPGAEKFEAASAKPPEAATSVPTNPKPGTDADPVERLKKSQEQAVNEAAEAFRKRLADMLAGFRLGGKEGGER